MPPGTRRVGSSSHHHHFLERHGGVAVFPIRSDDEGARLADPGPLHGWELAVHPLVFSLAAVGSAAQLAVDRPPTRAIVVVAASAGTPAAAIIASSRWPRAEAAPDRRARAQPKSSLPKEVLPEEPLSNDSIPRTEFGELNRGEVRAWVAAQVDEAQL